MNDPAEFLLARIAEDEAAWTPEINDLEIGNIAERILAECEAKRRIVDLHCRSIRMPDKPIRKSWRSWGYEGGVDGCSTCGDGSCPTLMSLAAVYADHPDYDPTWRL